MALLLGNLPAAVAAPAGPEAPETASNEAAAVRAALESGERVEALSERTVYSQVFAEPTGALTYEASPVPQFVKRADGSWEDIDVSLSVAADGTVRPAATLADVRFSGGGAGPVVTLVDGAGSMAMTWPYGELPAPVLSEDSATYAEVLDGVDLVVRATRAGFTHVLVVKTPGAAADPKLRDVTFEVSGDARAEKLADGSLEFVVGSAVLASAAPPQMWDSTVSAGVSAAQARVAAAAGGEAASAAEPGGGSAIAKLTVETTEQGDLRLLPDTADLGAAPVFPVYIDPAWSTDKTRWAYATSNNSNNTDVSRARVGSDPDSGKLYRSFFEFPTTALKGKYIREAYVQMRADHSASCTDTWTYMYHSGVLKTPRSPWSTNLIKRVSAAAGHANQGDGCSDSPQADMWMNFSGADVTALIQSVATKGAANITVGFSAAYDIAGNGEGAAEKWKKFYLSNAKLIADIDAVPGKPSGLQVAGIACTTAGVTIGIADPYFSATVSDADGTTQKLTAEWQFYEAPVGGSMTAKTAPANTSATANTRTTSARVSGLVGGHRYAFRVRATDPAPYSKTGSWSEYCYFSIDTLVPPVVVTQVSAPAGAGRPGVYKISSTATDVTTFKYGWTEATTSQIAAAAVTGEAGKQATVTVVPPRYGINVLYVRAIDATLNQGYASYETDVLRPSPAVARWRLETYPGADEQAALADEQPSLAGDNVLTASGVSWADKGRVVDVHNVDLIGTGKLTTPGFLNTTGSYSVAAWVRLDATAADQTVISQDGANTAVFRLDSRASDKSWCFGLSSADNASSASYTAACAANTAAAGRWTHVAGSFDANSKILAIWVDGVQKATVSAPTAWNATGPLRLGARKAGTAEQTGALDGSVADAQVFDRVIVANDFTGTLAEDEFSGGFDEPGILAPLQVAAWNFESARPCNDDVVAGSCKAADADTAWRRRLALTSGVTTTEGYSPASQKSLDFDRTHWTEDESSPFYGLTTTEVGTSERNYAAAGEADRWTSGPVLHTSQSFTVSVWLQPSQLTGPGATTMTAVSQKGAAKSAFYLGIRELTVDGVTGPRFVGLIEGSDDPNVSAGGYSTATDVLTVDDTTEWAHVVFVYNAADSSTQLYVNGKLAASGTGVPFEATGPLAVGNAWYTPPGGTGSWTDPWVGRIDELQLYQGAMTAGAVAQLHTEQANAL